MTNNKTSLIKRITEIFQSKGKTENGNEVTLRSDSVSVFKESKKKKKNSKGAHQMLCYDNVTRAHNGLLKIDVNRYHGRWSTHEMID